MAGDAETADATVARDGSKKAAATLANGKKLSAMTTDAIPVAKRAGSKAGAALARRARNPSSHSLVDTPAEMKFESEGLLVNIAIAIF
jgi:hypothetical protein